MASWTEINNARFMPAGCVTVADAFNALGKSVFNRSEIPAAHQWTGDEQDFRDWGSRPAKPHLVFEESTNVIIDLAAYKRDRDKVAALLGLDIAAHLGPLTFDEWRGAVDRWERWETSRAGNQSRRDWIFEYMQRLASAGGLIFVRIDAKTGERWTINKDRWNCDRQHAADRFRYAALNTNMKWIMGGTIRPWERDNYLKSFDEPFYVGSRSLVDMLKAIDERWPAAAAVVAAGGDYSDMLMAEALGEPQDDVEVENTSASSNQGAPLEGRAPMPTRTRKFNTKEQSERWYRDRKAEADRHGKKFSRAEDEVAGKDAGIPRERVRELRRQLAPDWTDPGRPNKSGE